MTNNRNKNGFEESYSQEEYAVGKEDKLERNWSDGNISKVMANHTNKIFAGDKSSKPFQNISGANLQIHLEVVKILDHHEFDFSSFKDNLWTIYSPNLENMDVLSLAKKASRSPDKESSAYEKKLKTIYQKLASSIEQASNQPRELSSRSNALLGLIRNLVDVALNESISHKLLKQCPELLQWTTNLNDMEERGILLRVETIQSTGIKGSRRENALEWALRMFEKAELGYIPYLHEIRAANPTLAHAIENFQYRHKAKLKDMGLKPIAVKD